MPDIELRKVRLASDTSTQENYIVFQAEGFEYVPGSAILLRVYPAEGRYHKLNKVFTNSEMKNRLPLSYPLGSHEPLGQIYEKLCPI